MHFIERLNELLELSNPDQTVSELPDEEVKSIMAEFADRFSLNASLDKLSNEANMGECRAFLKDNFSKFAKGCLDQEDYKKKLRLENEAKDANTIQRIEGLSKEFLNTTDSEIHKTILQKLKTIFLNSSNSEVIKATLNALKTTTAADPTAMADVDKFGFFENHVSCCSKSHSDPKVRAAAKAVLDVYPPLEPDQLSSSRKERPGRR